MVDPEVAPVQYVNCKVPIKATAKIEAQLKEMMDLGP